MPCAVHLLSGGLAQPVAPRGLKLRDPCPLEHPLHRGPVSQMSKLSSWAGLVVLQFPGASGCHLGQLRSGTSPPVGHAAVMGRHPANSGHALNLWGEGRETCPGGGVQPCPAWEQRQVPVRGAQEGRAWAWGAPPSLPSERPGCTQQLVHMGRRHAQRPPHLGFQLQVQRTCLRQPWRSSGPTCRSGARRQAAGAAAATWSLWQVTRWQGFRTSRGGVGVCVPSGEQFPLLQGGGRLCVCACVFFFFMYLRKLCAWWVLPPT